VDLIGYQEYVDWMDARVLTLADLWPHVPRAMIVGLNPAPPSVAAGHYYQGKVGQQQIRRLTRAGLFTAPALGTFVEVNALAAGVGFTDIVKRPTPRERGVAAQELAHGRAVLARELEERGIELVLCVFRHPVNALLGSDGPPGFQPQRTSWGARVFRLPGPMQDAVTAAAVMAELTAALP
jgi:TDG/mug DNA glycosylase family protein